MVDKRDDTTKTIWKFPVPTRDERAALEMPKGARILTVQTQGLDERPELWALVDPGANREIRIFRTYGTGHPIDHDPGEYVATYQIHSVGLVFHVFEQLSARSEA